VEFLSKDLEEKVDRVSDKLGIEKDDFIQMVYPEDLDEVRYFQDVTPIVEQFNEVLDQLSSDTAIKRFEKLEEATGITPSNAASIIRHSAALANDSLIELTSETSIEAINRFPDTSENIVKMMSSWDIPIDKKIDQLKDEVFIESIARMGEANLEANEALLSSAREFVETHPPRKLNSVDSLERQSADAQQVLEQLEEVANRVDNEHQEIMLDALKASQEAQEEKPDGQVSTTNPEQDTGQVLSFSDRLKTEKPTTRER